MLAHLSPDNVCYESRSFCWAFMKTMAWTAVVKCSSFAMVMILTLFPKPNNHYCWLLLGSNASINLALPQDCWSWQPRKLEKYLQPLFLCGWVWTCTGVRRDNKKSVWTIKQIWRFEIPGAASYQSTWHIHQHKTTSSCHITFSVRWPSFSLSF